MASLQNADIILNSIPSAKTLRGVCANLEIPCITLEIGSPQKFQNEMVDESLIGIRNILIDLGMIDDEIKLADKKPVVCRRSYWLRSARGGILEVSPKITEFISKDQEIAILRDIYA